MNLEKTSMNYFPVSLRETSICVSALSVNCSSRIVICSINECVRVWYKPSIDCVASSLAYFIVLYLNKSILIIKTILILTMQFPLPLTVGTRAWYWIHSIFASDSYPARLIFLNFSIKPDKLGFLLVGSLPNFLFLCFIAGIRFFTTRFWMICWFFRQVIFLLRFYTLYKSLWVC